MSWYMQSGEILEDPPEHTQGFIYRIDNLETGEWYIGKKNFWTKKKYPPLQGKKRNRYKLVETDWRDYQSSSNLVQTWPEDKIKKTILHMACDKTMLALLETKEQLKNENLYSKYCVNQMIHCRINLRNLKPNQ